MKTIFLLVFKQLTERKLRSFLTMLGISIGIAALIALVLLSGALKSGVTRQLDRFGSDVILIAPKASLVGTNGGPAGFGSFSTEDVKVVENIPQVMEVQPLLRTTVTVEYGREKIRQEVRGTKIETEDALYEFLDKELLTGTYISHKDQKQVMIGSKFATESFEKDIFVGSTIRINDDKYTVSGIFLEEGSQSEDYIVITNIDDLRDTLGESKAVTALSVTIAPGADIDVVDARIKRALERARGEEDFATTTPAGIKDSVGDVLGVVDIVVFSVALISLFVASLGVMNSLFTSVYQRTKEIGTMKAIGARNSQILSIFVLESAMMGFFGGLIGILVGTGLAYIFISAVNAFGFVRLELAFSFSLALGALIFSTVLGILAGFLPALRASKLKPVDALRFE